MLGKSKFSMEPSHVRICFDFHFLHIYLVHTFPQILFPFTVQPNVYDTLNCLKFVSFCGRRSHHQLLSLSQIQGQRKPNRLGTEVPLQIASPGRLAFFGDSFFILMSSNTTWNGCKSISDHPYYLYIIAIINPFLTLVITYFINSISIL